MMKPRTLRYLVSEGVQGVRRHRALTVTAVITMAASLLVLGVFLITAFNMFTVIDELQDRKEVVVYLQDGVSSEDRAMLEERLAMHPSVQGAVFVTKEEAWQEFSSTMEVEGLLDAVGENPLPDSYRLELNPAHRTAAEIQGLAEEVSYWDEVDDVVTGGAWVGRLDKFARAVFLFTASIGLAVALSIVAIVANTVRLTVVARRDLVEIMKAIGASENFIRLPFLSEGVIQAFLAGALSLGVLYGATLLVSQRIAGVAFFDPLWAASFLGFALLLGLIGSAVSVRQVLRQTGI